MTDQVYDRRFFQAMGTENDNAAIILDILFQRYMPSSLLDVGCGSATWAATAKRMGVRSVFGIDGDYLDSDLMAIGKDEFAAHDLGQPFDLRRRFDLVVCTEVAEHLSRARAASFVADLTRHADVILFSAAAPFQGGTHHVNEQWLEYWGILFRKQGFIAVDMLRQAIWADNRVQYYFRQNIIIFARPTVAQLHFGSTPQDERKPLAFVHPIFLLETIRKFFPDMHTVAYYSEIEDYQNLAQAYANGEVELPYLTIPDGVESVAVGNGQQAAREPEGGARNHRGYYFSPVTFDHIAVADILHARTPR